VPIDAVNRTAVPVAILDTVKEVVPGDKSLEDNPFACVTIEDPAY
jgi:hypothetical protein